MDAFYKVGDRVRVIPRKGLSEDHFQGYINEMTKQEGKTFTISSVKKAHWYVQDDFKYPCDGHIYHFEEDPDMWDWTTSMFESVCSIKTKSKKKIKLNFT